MKVDIELSNYRCFTAPSRVKLRLDGSIIALVGPNNAGKSAFLKFFYEFREMFRAIAGGHLQTNVNFPPEVTDPIQVFSNANGDSINIWLAVASGATPLQATHSGATMRVCNGVEIEVTRPPSPQYKVTRLLSNGFQATPPFTWKRNGEIAADNSARAEFDMRAVLAASAALADSLYLPPFRNAINVGSREQHYDVPSGVAFIKLLESLYQGTQGTVAAQTALNVQEQIEKIFRFDRLEIRPHEGSQSIQIVINGIPYRIDQLGSGLAQFILTLHKAADKNPSLLLIDEPEANLHPTMQLDLLTTLASYVKVGRLGTVVATHSLGLATATNSRIYSVSRQSMSDAAIVRDFDELQNPVELLGELSYAGRYDLGLRKILLVEGTTDIKVFQQFLRKIQYDHEVSILPLGGSSVISKHALRPLVSLRRLSRNLFAIIDRETDQDAAMGKSIKTFSRICTRLMIPHLVMERRSIENYLTDPYVGNVMGSGLAALNEHDPVPPRWSKSRNWLVARQMPFTDIEGTDVGKFLLELKNAATT